MKIWGRGQDTEQAVEPRPVQKGDRMIGAKKEGAVSANAGELNALLGRGSEFEGKLSFEGTVRIDGRFRGEIRSQGTLMIGEAAVVEAEIMVEVAVIGGEVHGNITAQNKIELQATARVTGNLSTPTLVVKEGGRFDGQCQMQNRERPARPVSLLSDAGKESSP